MVREFDFYIVPTPIGNIQDITLRAIEILKSVDFIACEDTRNTQKLLNHYNIETKCISYHKYNERERINCFIEKLKEGKKIALVSDAGTPMICDPGAIIIEELVKYGFSVTSLPGACAITTFLSAIPRNTEDFKFLGFMPRGENEIYEIFTKHTNQNIVFYESPERILNTLLIIKNARENAKIALGRELSKLYEEIKIGTVSEILDYYSNGIKGEIVCMVYAEISKENIDLTNRIKKLKNKGFRNKEISIILSELFNINKNEVYKNCLTTN